MYRYVKQGKAPVSMGAGTPVMVSCRCLIGSLVAALAVMVAMGGLFLQNQWAQSSLQAMRRLQEGDHLQSGTTTTATAGTTAAAADVVPRILPHDRRTTTTALFDEEARALASIIENGCRAQQTQTHTPRPAKAKTVDVALIGAGGFARSTYLPNLAELSAKGKKDGAADNAGNDNDSVIRLRYIVVRGDVKRTIPGAPVGAKITNDVKRAIQEVDLVIIATRHDSHAELATRALHAGKWVLCEKPMAMSSDQMVGLLDGGGGKRGHPYPAGSYLTVGYNRRHSPIAVRVKEIIDSSSVGGGNNNNKYNPVAISYRVNTPSDPATSWLFDMLQGGGPNIGEACHFYDLFSFWTAGDTKNSKSSNSNPPVSVRSSPLFNGKAELGFLTTVVFRDSSVATLFYVYGKDKGQSKERIEIIVGGKGDVLVIDDWKTLTINSKTVADVAPGKGHRELLQRVVTGAAATGADRCDKLELSVDAALISYEAQAQIEEHLLLNANDVAQDSSGAFPDFPTTAGSGSYDDNDGRLVLTPEQRELFLHSGVLKLPRKLPTSLVERAKEAFFNELKNPTRKEHLVITKTEQRISQIFSHPDQIFASLLAWKPMVDALEQLVDGPVELATNRHNHASMRRSENKRATYFHRDTYSRSHNFVTALIYLEDSTYETGCTRFVPGSHNMVLQERDFGSVAQQEIGVPMPAGSVLLMDAHVWHRLGPATGVNRTRMTLTAAYSAHNELVDTSEEQKYLVKLSKVEGDEYKGNVKN